MPSDAAAMTRVIYTVPSFHPGYGSGWIRRPDLDRPGYGAECAWITPAPAVTWECERCGCTWESRPEGYCEHFHDEPPRCQIVSVEVARGG